MFSFAPHFIPLSFKNRFYLKIFPFSHFLSLLNLSFSIVSGHTIVRVFRVSVESIVALGHCAMKAIRISVKMAEYASKLKTFIFSFSENFMSEKKWQYQLRFNRWNNIWRLLKEKERKKNEILFQEKKSDYSSGNSTFM